MTGKVRSFYGVEELNDLQELRYALDQTILTAKIDASSGVLISANEKFLQVFGYSPEEILKVYFSRLLSQDSRKLFSDEIFPIVSRGVVWKGELCHVARNGRHFWTETGVVPIPDKSSGFRYLQFIAFEITERKAVEIALTNQSQFFTTIMDLAPAGFFLADSEGQCSYVNRLWEKVSGCQLRQAWGRGWLRAVYFEDRERVESAWFRFVANGGTFHCEYRYQQPSNAITWVQATAERVNFDGLAKTRSIRVELDLTERKESERIISHQREQMIATSKMSALGEMAGGIAHEINNPLAILQLWGKQIVRLVKSKEPHTAELIAAAANIQSTTDRIAGIIRSLRAIAREAHGDPFVRSSVAALISDTLTLCLARFHVAGIDLNVLPFDDKLEIECRPVEIMQILLNLLNNAFSAVEELPEKWVKIAVLEFADEVNIGVTDSGSGIPIDQQEKIFQPFYSTKPVGSGTGLGLSICRAMALNHEGELRLDKRSPHTRFVLTLPKVLTKNLEAQETSL